MIYLVSTSDRGAAANVGGRGAILVSAASEAAALTQAAVVLCNDSEANLQGSAALTAFEDSGLWVATEVTAPNLETVAVRNVPGSVSATVFDGMLDSARKRGR